MTDAVDKIGVIRGHRWVGAFEQWSILRDRCRVVLTLDKPIEKGRGVKAVTRDELMNLVRPETATVVEMVHAFLLADPRKRRVVGGMKADFHAAVERLIKRGGVLVDVDTGLSTADPGHRKALVALAEDQIARSNKGLHSAANGAKSTKGRQPAKFADAELLRAEAVWFNRGKYPTWAAVMKALPKGFTTARAHRLWGPRSGKH